MKRTKLYAVLGAVAVAAAGSVIALGGTIGGLRVVPGEKAGAAVVKEAKAELGVLKGRASERDALEAAPKPVPAAKVEAVTEHATLRLTGSLIADEESEVGTNVPGIVQEVFVERGSVVEKGDVLVQLDPADPRNLLAEGEAAVEELRVRLGLANDAVAFNPEDQPEVKTAKAALDLSAVTDSRYADMVKQGIASKEVYDQAHTEWQSARQRYDQAVFQARQLYQSYLTAKTRLAPLRKAVEDTTIRAPFNGWVMERRVSAGERLAPGKDGVVAVLVKIDPLRLALTVPQQNSLAVSSGQKVTFTVDGIGDRIFEGEVRHVAPAVQANSRSMMVEAIVENRDGLLRPGLFASAELVMPETKTRLLVPEGAVVKQGEVSTVYVVQDGLARERVASLGESIGGRVEVLTGLAKGDVVLTEPARVNDGDSVDAQLN